jgi:hypothetical protein
MSGSLIALLAIAVLFGLLMLAGITRMNRQRSGLDKQYYEKQWGVITGYKNNGGPGWQMAVIEADKLLDNALSNRNFAGQTMGERLKSAKGSFMNNDAIWQAHKLRNRLAHEQNVQLNIVVVEQALRAFRNGLKDLGAL